MTDFRTLIPLLGYGDAPEALKHVQTVESREAVTGPWPAWVDPALREAYERRGVERPWLHQIQAADLAWQGQHVILATGTASGKSLAYLMPSLSRVLESEATPFAGTVLYLAPTKALAADQLSSLNELKLPGLRAETYDGDTDPQERRWIREHANFLLTNPDMLHYGILGNHAQWARFFRDLQFVIIDEAHSYKGVFGSHIANLMRRLNRVCRRLGSAPVFIGASATSAEPEVSFGKLVGQQATAVTTDFSPHGEVTVALWEPPLTDFADENGAPRRRSVVAETSDLLANLVTSHVRTISFIKSRRGTEAIASLTQKHLEEVDPALGQRVAAYRSGYLPEERRELERRLRNGELLGIASTSALELGIDIAGLDAVLVSGWPGTRASFFQQIGRAGRAGQDALAVLVASDDPLDTYLVNHPEAIFDRSVEATVFDPSNPYVLGPHLCAAAEELPLKLEEVEDFGPTAAALLDRLVEQGYLRRRPSGWFWVHPQSAAGMVNIRADGGGPVNIVDTETGALLGTMDSPQTHFQAHNGAIYTHQGQTFVVDELNETDHCVFVTRANPNFYTQARDITKIDVIDVQRHEDWGPVTAQWGDVVVTTKVVSFQRKALISNEILGEEPLELPPRDLHTKAVWFTIPETSLAAAGISIDEVPGALHAAEHAMIGLLPLVASSDRWDIGGVSTALHIDTEAPTIFVYDGHPGGAGFVERGYERAFEWITATRDAVSACECESGCPSCVQSPKCGNKNNPLSKAGAIALLTALLKNFPQHPRRF
ncbi:DEAD/DEAH box helicase [Neomicrococcus lactis]|uniref:DEAD/DEAH box helicase domain-containing protein n=1 Tax=Neomicrococcus lactis TaxID=732241 RepID=A0A7W8YD61_9MICC|nr:DEAD/DEAH box helicase domain-containing protein [Neomicrococcus lactis]